MPPPLTSPCVVACLQVRVVLGIHNDASETYNITSIMGSVNSPADFKTFIHNLTHQVRGGGARWCRRKGDRGADLDVRRVAGGPRGLAPATGAS